MDASYLGLGNEEPDEDEHAQAEAGESDESTVSALAHGHQHVGHGASDDKVEEPLSGGGERDVETAETSGWDLGDVDPADLRDMSVPHSGFDVHDWQTYRTPAPLEERREEVDADKCDVAGGRNGCILLRRGNAHEETNVHHRQTHGDGSP